MQIYTNHYFQTNNNMTNPFKRETTIRISEPDAVEKTLVRRLVSVKTTPTIVEEEYELVEEEEEEQVPPPNTIQRQVLPLFARGITYWNPLNIPQHERGWKPPDGEKVDDEEEENCIRLQART